MEDLIPLISNAQEVWKEFNFGEKKEAWDSNIKPQLEGYKDESQRGKRRLGEKTKELRGMTDEEKVKGMGGLIRAYQEEIDKANQRYSFVEGLHSSMWSVLQRAQDPLVLINTTKKAIREEEADKQSIATEGLRLRKELAAKTKQLEEGQQNPQTLAEKDTQLAKALKKVEELEGEKKNSIEQYKKISASITRLSELERINAEQSEKLKEMEVERAQLESDLANSSKIGEESNDAKVEDLEQELKKLHSEKEELATALEQERAKSLQREEELKQTVENNEETINQLKTDLTTKAELVESLNKNIEHLQLESQALSHNNQEIEVLRSEITTTKKQLELVTAEKETMQEQVQHKQERVEALESELDAAKSTSSGRDESEDATLEEKDKEIAALIVRLENSKRDLETANTKVASLDTQVSDLQARIEDDTLDSDLFANRAAESTAAAENSKTELERVKKEAEISKNESERELASAKALVETYKADAESAKLEVTKIKLEAEQTKDALDNQIIELQITINSLTEKGELEKGDNDTEIKLTAEIAQLKDALQQSESKNATLVEELDDKEQAVVEYQIEASSKEIDLSAAIANSQQLEHTISDNVKKIAELEKQQQEAISENLLNQEVIQQQLHTIAQLKGEEESRVSTPRNQPNFQDALVEELTELVATLRANNEKLSAETQENLSEYDKLKKLVREKDERIATMMENEDSKDLSEVLEGLRNESQQLSTELENKTTLLDHFKRDANEKDEKISKLVEQEVIAKRELREKDEKIKELEEAELNIRKSIGTAETHTVELTKQLEQLNDTVRLLEDQLDHAREEGKEKDDRIAEIIQQMQEEVHQKGEKGSGMSETIQKLEAELQSKEEKEEITREEIRKLHEDVQIESEKHAVVVKEIHKLQAVLQGQDEELDNLSKDLRKKEEQLKKVEEDRESMQSKIKEMEVSSSRKESEAKERATDKEKELATLKSQHSTVVSKLQSTEQRLGALQSTNSSQLEKIIELEQILISKDENFALRGKSTDAEAKRKVEHLATALEAKDTEIADLKSKHIDGIKQLVAKNAELLVQLEKHESVQSDLERNIADLANSYRQVSERAELDASAKEQAQDALATTKNTIKTLQGELDTSNKAHEDHVAKVTKDYETKLSAASINMHEVSLSDRYEEMIKETQALHREVQRLEGELETAKEGLRRKEATTNQERSPLVTDVESNDLWTRLGGGSNMVCYVPVAALSYWRRWRGRPNYDVHTS